MATDIIVPSTVNIVHILIARILHLLQYILFLSLYVSILIVLYQLFLFYLVLFYLVFDIILFQFPKKIIF